MKKLRKGFTIVELVIVIAVIAVLTAILVPTFVHLSKKANQASDNSLVHNLNTALKMDVSEGNEKPVTMQEAVEALDRQGYRVPQLVTKSDQDLVYSIEKNEFCLSGDAEGDHASYWHVQSTAINTGGWSIYAYNWAGSPSVENLTVGFDAGTEKGIASVSYVDAGGKRAIIRTNEGCSVTINAVHDTVSHYNEAESVNIIAVDKDNSYHEFGRVSGAIKLSYGNFVAESGSQTTTLVVDAESYSNVSINLSEDSSVGALVDYNNIVPAEVQDDFEYVVTSESTTNTVEEIIASVAYIESNGVKTYYDDLQAALDNASGGEKVVLTNDVTKSGSGSLFTYLATTADRSATLDLNGKMIKAKLANTASCQVIKVGSLNADKAEYQHTASLTLADSNAPLHGYKTGAIIATPDRYSDSWNVAVSAFSIQRLGSLTVDSGKIIVDGEDVAVNPNADNPYCIDVLTNTGSQNANLTINGGYIASNMETGVGVRAFCNSATGTVNITMNNGYVFGDSRAFMLQYPSNNKKCLLNCVINGGTLESATRALDVLNFNTSEIADSSFVITVNGGSFISHNDAGKVKFPGSDILYVSYSTGYTAHITFIDNRH